MGRCGQTTGTDGGGHGDVQDRQVPVDGASPPRPHALLIAERRARGWGRDRLAVEFERAAGKLGLRTPDRSALVKAIYRHETGRAEVRDELYVRLYCDVYELGRHELLGDTDVETAGSVVCDVTSHKFVPIHLGGVDVAELLTRARRFRPGTALGVECWRGRVPHPDGGGELFVFPWGVASVHLAEPLNVPSLSAIASWRRRTYPPTRAWATGVVRETLGCPSPSAHYVMSAYWLDSPPWSGPTLGTAMRLLAKSRVLLGRTDGTGEPSPARAEQMERILLRDGFRDSRIDEFGVQGVSVGCATWGGVSYCPLSAQRALVPADLVELEALVQALWCHCHHLREQVERGDDPAVAPKFGWRWLRGMRSRLTVARPNESAQHAALREAVLSASGLADHLATAVEHLRDAERSSVRGPDGIGADR